MEQPKVNVLLSTYNGEEYLRCQLDSLLAQDYGNFTVFVRDDGSRDATASIIREYALKDGRIIFMNDPGEGQKAENLGYKGSFWTLLRQSPEADYYSFCDQDDFWEHNKISRGVAALQEYDRSIPLLYSSSFDYYDENLQWSGHPALPSVPVQFKDVLFYTPAFGFTIMINGKLRETALSASDLTDIPHDCWCEKIAALFGKFVFDPAKTAKYRRHSKTVTYANSSRLQLLSSWLRNDIFGEVMREYRFYTTRLHDEYTGRTGISEEDSEILKLFSDREKGPGVYFRRLFFPHRLRPSAGGEIALRLCFLLNR